MKKIWNLALASALAAGLLAGCSNDGGKPAKRPYFAQRNLIGGIASLGIKG